VISVNLRAERIASDECLDQSKETVNRNGYPVLFVNKIRQRICQTPKEPVNYIDFVKVPFLSEARRQLILRKSYQTGM
jgi:hypothetical protein